LLAALGGELALLEGLVIALEDVGVAPPAVIG
jgi:hypothetical protein